MATLEERIAAAKRRQESLNPPADVQTIASEVQAAKEYSELAGMASSVSADARDKSLVAADAAADALTLAVAAEAAAQGFSEQARDAKELSLSAADAAADAADAASDAYKGAASAAASAEGWATETKDATLFPDGAAFLQNAITNKTISLLDNGISIVWNNTNRIQVGDSSTTGGVDMWASVNMHGRNVTHGAGRALFTYAESGKAAHAEMSGRGFLVRWGNSATPDTNPKIIELDSVTNGDPFMEFTDTTGTHKVRIESTVSGSKITVDGATAIVQEEVAIALADGVATATTLKHYGVYNITVPADATAFDLRTLSIAEPFAAGETIAHLWISLEAGEEAFTGQDWPAMVWVNEVNTDEPPTLERGKEYLVAILRRGDYIAANIALTK